MDQTSFTVSYHELMSDLSRYLETYKRRLSCQFLIGILLSLSLAWITSDIKPLLGLSAPQIKVIFCLAYIVVAAYLLRDCVRCYKVKVASIEEFCRYLMKKSETTYYEPTCLFVFTRREKELKATKFLAFFHKPTSSYYLPYVAYSKDRSIPEQRGDIEATIANRLRIHKPDMHIEWHEELDFEYKRFSSRKNAVVTYENKVFTVSLEPDEQKHFTDKTFPISGREYKWLSIEEFKDHRPSESQNGPIVDLLEKNAAVLLDLGQQA